MARWNKGLIATTAVVAVLAVGCGSSSKSSSAGSTTSSPGSTNSSGSGTSGGGTNGSGGASSAGSGNHTYTVGVLADVTGASASANKTFLPGVQAGLIVASQQGYTIKYVLADTTSTTAGALTAAQRLVEQDHVLAVLVDSTFTFAAAPFLASHNVPVVGAAIDANEWDSDKNMFAESGVLHFNLVATTTGQFLKNQGVTNFGSIGYSISPSSGQAAEAAAASAKAAGLKVGYLNVHFPLGGTNAEPAALAMKNAGVNGFSPEVDTNTGFALVTALQQLGDNVKVALLADGYGGDLIQAGPGALQAAQNVYFETGDEPVEMHTSATQQFVNDLKAVGAASEPTVAEYHGYAAVGLLLQGLKAAGTTATQASLLSGLSSIHSFDALGLFGSHPLDVNDRTSVVVGPDNCVYFTKLVGSAFQLVPGADPLCGTTIPGLTVPAP